jgi:hypothetical protein
MVQPAKALSFDKNQEIQIKFWLNAHDTRECGRSVTESLQSSG